MLNRTFLPDEQRKRFQAAITFLGSFHLGPGFLALLLLMAAVSFVVTYDWGPTPKIYSIGEIAEYDIAADRSFNVQDTKATKLKLEAVQSAHPLIATLNFALVEELRERIQNMLVAVNQALEPEDMEALRLTISDEIGEEISAEQFQLLANPTVQNIIANQVLPWLEQRMRGGVVSDVRILAAYPGGVLVRSLSDGSETLHLDSVSATDLRGLTMDLSLRIRSLSASAQIKRLLNTLFSSQIMPTLTPNYEATSQRSTEAAKSVQPVIHEIQAGEIIVRQGEKIGPEQFVKLQALWKRTTKKFSAENFFGVLTLTLLIVAGLFFVPENKKDGSIKQKELVFIGSLVAFVALLSKAFYFIGFLLASISPGLTLGTQAFAVPVAGAAGLAALTLSSRRYYTICLLLAFFCTIVNKGGIGIFLFYFSTSVLSSRMISDSQTRKDVVWNLAPLALGMTVIWLGCTLLEGGAVERFLPEFLAVLLSSFLSLVFVFAFSPIVEMIFGFTTRFVLMELMNQEHPALRRLMLSAPGTYHHSIIVASMAELAAKSIGAHSLLCKVAATYHDIGKTDKAEYFIENQFRGDNPHDRLTPAMSALVLISHVKYGAEMALQHNLGQEITSIITQHHGNSLIRFFYGKALDASRDKNIREEDFSYAGPRPQSREAAIIMLADVVEASSRTLIGPTSSRIKAHVHKIIRSVLAEGQLDAAELTFKDINLVAESFIIILTGIFHKRIEYPDRVSQKPGLEEVAEGMPELQYNANAVDYNVAQWVESQPGRSGRPSLRKTAPDAKKNVGLPAGKPKSVARGKSVPKKSCNLYAGESANLGGDDADKAAGVSKNLRRRRGVPPGYRRPGWKIRFSGNDGGLEMEG